jgi:hypothetical protein
MAKDKRLVKPCPGPLPDILGKGGPMKDKTKYTRKRKHKDEEVH